ncbi:hypothetical protein JW930_07340 [Candidatus Woesearchaeota archaeon]|nr:hypothetical protein [Candidatus Woesearchaeota archaeon]
MLEDYWSPQLYDPLLYEGLLFAAGGTFHQGIPKYDRATGTSYSRGLNLGDLISRVFPIYAHIAPAITHGLCGYGFTLTVGGALGHYFYNSPSLVPFIIGFTLCSIVGVLEIVSDVKLKKTSLCDILQWIADFSGPLAALIRAYHLLF